LITGLAGVGKRDFANWLVESILCRDRTADGACGDCSACRQLLADAHPDYRRVEPAGASTTVRIDAVRALVEWLQLTPTGDGHRIALVFGADTLNRNAANALLKTLEEPGDAGVLVLVADRAGALPPTVRSRCQRIVLQPGDPATALTWLAGRVDDPTRALARAGGLPFAALEVLDEDREKEMTLLLMAWQDLFLHRGSVGRIVDSLADLPTTRCLEAFLHWTALTVRHLAGPGVPNESVPHEGVPDEADAGDVVGRVMAATAPSLSIENWFSVHDILGRLYRSDSASFRTRTVAEGMLADIRLMISIDEAGRNTP